MADWKRGESARDVDEKANNEARGRGKIAKKISEQLKLMRRQKKKFQLHADAFMTSPEFSGTRPIPSPFERERDEMRFGRSWISHCLGKVHSGWSSFICAMRRIGKKGEDKNSWVLDSSRKKNLSNYTKPFIFANHIEHHLLLGGALEICVFFLSLLKTLSLVCHHENYTEMNLRRAMASSTWDTHVCQKSFINCAIFHWLLSFSLTLQGELYRNPRTRGVETSPSWLLLCEWALRCVSR